MRLASEGSEHFSSAQNDVIINHTEASEKCATIAQRHAEETAKAFAEWIHDKLYGRHLDGFWDNHVDRKLITTEELYSRFKEQTS